jgi:glycosyltransferase involved in cell wall biosynthesis
MRKIALSLDQLRRPSAGGIGTYIRGLTRGLDELVDTGELDAQIVGLLPRGPRLDLGLAHVKTTTMFANESMNTRLWARTKFGVPRDSDIVHATSMAGPFRGGSASAVHSMLIHDLLWREHRELTTRRGAAFHEARLQMVVRQKDLRALVTSQNMKEKLVSAGVNNGRVHVVRLGLDSARSASEVSSVVRSRVDELTEGHGSFTLAVGTIQPRKNLERLIAAHARARITAEELGPLLLVGARGWGEVNTTGASELGELDNETLQALVASARVVAYVPIEEGWGLPAVEALAIGRPLVASTTVPSVSTNGEAIRVDALSIEQISDALVSALHQDDDEPARDRRRASVQHLSWASCAREHVAAWS